jgi:hypothetical protein
MQSRRSLRHDYSKFARSTYHNAEEKLEPETFAEFSRSDRRRPSISCSYEYEPMIREPASEYSIIRPPTSRQPSYNTVIRESAQPSSDSNRNPLAEFERYPGDDFEGLHASSSRYTSNIHANSREYDETVTRALNASHNHSTARQGEYNTVTRIHEYHIVEHVPVYITETRESQRHREPQCYRVPERYRTNTHYTDRYERIPSIRRLADASEARQRRKDRRRRKEPEREEGRKPNIKLTALERFAAHVVGNL